MIREAKVYTDSLLPEFSSYAEEILMGIPFENTLAAGDAENDISMLQAVATPCVMKNARPEMYPYGKYITERDNNHSGVAEIIEKFML